jgi:hypothetical protein
MKDLVEQTGLPQDEVLYRLNRLAQSEFIGVDRRATGIAGVTEVLPKGWQVTTGEPNELGASMDVIVGRLQAEMDREPDLKRKGVLATLATAVRDFSLEFGPKASAELLAKVMKVA